jgi:accessory gene regulator B
MGKSMRVIEKFSEKMATMIIKEGNLEDGKKAVLAYGVFSMIQPVLSLFFTLIIAMIFNVWIEAIVISVAASMLRKNSGGAHASSAERCLIIGVFIFVLLACLTKFTLVKLPVVMLSFIFLMSIFMSYYIISKYSPVDSPSKPIKESDRGKFRKKSVKTLNVFTIAALVFFLTSFFGYSYLSMAVSIMVGVFWQSLTLVKIGETILSGLDIFIRKIKI